MTHRRYHFVTAVLMLAAPALLDAQPTEGKPTLVTVDNFTRAESHRFFGNVVNGGGLGKIRHQRELTPIDRQTIVRANRDTLYSSAVFDLDAGPVTITLPDPGKRYMAMQVFDEDHYSPGVVYGAGDYTFTREKIGTRYVLVGIRTLVDPGNPQDVRQAHALQDAVKVSHAGPGRFEVPDWDGASQKKVRDALLTLGETVRDLHRTFGTREQVLPVRHLIATATAWGGSPEKDASYLTITPSRNDGNTIHKLEVREVPVDAFWSISVYNAEGYFQANPYAAYTLNNLTSKRSKDGSVQVQFGGCDGGSVNCLPITPRWNYMVRLYRPRAEILNGSWTFPEAQPLP